MTSIAFPPLACPAIGPEDVEEAHRTLSSSSKNSAGMEYSSNPVTIVTALRPFRILMVTEIGLRSPFLCGSQYLIDFEYGCGAGLLRFSIPDTVPFLHPFENLRYDLISSHELHWSTVFTP